MTAQPATQPHATHRVAVPGAELHYEVRGSGPLLLVVGQPMTAEPFTPLAELLAEDRTVVTYDPRGLGRSTVADPGRDVTPEDGADDLARIVDELGGGPADVFGTSGGAVAGLALVARHPGTVGVLVAHEPPLTELLPDGPHLAAAVDRVRDAFRAGGPGAGWGAFVSLVVHDGPVGAEGVPPASWPPPGATDGGEPDAGQAPPEPSPEQRAHDELFFLRMLGPLTRWLPPVEVLRAHEPRVVVAVGEASGQEIARRATDALAARLGAPAVPLPGSHAGFMEDPDAFARRLREILARAR